MSTPTPPHPGCFIVYEGGEGSGKTTQIRLLADALRQLGHVVTTTHEPGDTEVGRHIRQLLLDPAIGHLAHRTEALLFAADRAEHVATVIRPALTAGHIVISDRYMDSSAAYQGTGRGLSIDEIINLSMWAADGLVPDLTIVLDLDPSDGLGRLVTAEFGAADRIEQETRAFLNAVRHGFLALAARDPDRYTVLDASRSIDDIAADALAATINRLPATLAPTGT